MRPEARVQAAIELLDQIIAAARGGGAAADTLIARYFKDRRYAGSKDRRAVRDMVYAAIRRSGERPVSGRAAIIGLAQEQPDLRALFSSAPHGPASIAEDEPVSAAAAAPGWLIARLIETVPEKEIGSLLERAPLDVRVNTLKATRDNIIGALSGAVATPHSATGLRLPEGTQVEGLPQWTEGLIEVQDEGSQLAALATGAEPGMTVIDLCAGAGGKTLALAALMGNEGRLVACDTDRARLSRLAPRAARAGAAIIEARLLDPGRESATLADLTGNADIILVDAPCSGTGTWRRNPETRWRLTPERLERLVALQARLLTVAAALARPGGAVTYVVCSLLAEEGNRQVEAFAAANPGWTATVTCLTAGQSCGAGLILSPSRDGTDGFFVASLKAPC